MRGYHTISITQTSIPQSTLHATIDLVSQFEYNNQFLVLWVVSYVTRAVFSEILAREILSDVKWTLTRATVNRHFLLAFHSYYVHILHSHAHKCFTLHVYLQNICSCICIAVAAVNVASSADFTALQLCIRGLAKSICPSVRLSNAWIVTKGKKLLPKFLHHMKDQCTYFPTRRTVGEGVPLLLSCEVPL